MKSEDILNTLSDVSEEYIAEAATKKKKKAKKIIAASAAVAACMGFAFVGVFALRGGNDEPKWPIEEFYVGTGEAATWNETGWGEPHWDEKKLNEKFTYFEFNGTEYSISRRDESLSQSDVGASLGKVTLEGYDGYTDSNYETEGEAFELRGISSECALAIRFAEDDTTYVYRNRWYFPETLEDFASDLNFEENLSFGGASMNWFDDDGNFSRVEFEDFEDSAVWDMLLSDGSLENLGDTNAVSVLTVSVSHELLGYENMALCICEDGTVWTNIMGMQKTFFVGEEKTEAFIEWEIENVHGKQIVYDYPDEVATVSEEVPDGVETVVAYTSSAGFNPEKNTENEPPVTMSTYVGENGEMISLPYDPNQASSVLRAKIVEINGDTLLIEPCEGQWELSSADRIFFSVDWLPEKYSPAEGAVLVIEYDGLLMETYPAQINEPFSVTVE